MRSDPVFFIQTKRGNERMKKRIFIFFVFFVLFMWGSNSYASSVVEDNSLLSATSGDFYLRVKMQFLPLYLVFPDLDVRDEENKPLKDCKDLFLNTMNYRDNILNVWGVIKKRPKIGDIKLAIINLNKLQRAKAFNYTAYLDTAIYLSKEDLSLKLQVILC